MTENRRIALNIAATYGRSLFALACGVITSRWVLLSLGEVDYGLLGVVGSVMIFITFLNGVLAMSVSRYYAYSVGAERTAADPKAALEECRGWFSVAVTLHLIVPALLLTIGWPIGEWIVRHWLVIPADRMSDCVFVFRLSCIGCIAGMVAAPFTAMYTAKQEIAEMTMYSVAGTIGMVILSGYMITHPQVWLVPFSIVTCLMAVVPCVIQIFRAVKLFPECRLRPEKMLDIRMIKEMLSYAGLGVVGPVAILLRVQGVMVLVNRAFGPAVNASFSLARNVTEKSNTLSVSIKGAMAPAIVQACGAGDDARMVMLVSRMCKFASIATLFFAVPLVMELDYVLELWLKTPPPYLSGIALCMLAEYVAGVMTCGYDTAVYAKGRLALYQSVSAALSLSLLPAAWLAVKLGGGPYSVAVVAAADFAVFCIARLYMSSKLVGISTLPWWRGLFVPLVLTSGCAALAGLVPRLCMSCGLLRLAVVVLTIDGVFAILAWKRLIDSDERRIVIGKIMSRMRI